MECKDGSCGVPQICNHDSLKFVSTEYMACNQCGKHFKSSEFKKQ